MYVSRANNWPVVLSEETETGSILAFLDHQFLCRSGRLLTHVNYNVQLKGIRLFVAAGFDHKVLSRLTLAH